MVLLLDTDRLEESGNSYDMVSKDVCSIKEVKPEEGDSASYMLEVEGRGCSQLVTRMVAH